MRQGLVALDPKTGKEYFKRWFRASMNLIVFNPVVIGDQVFCSSAYSGDGSFVLKIKDLTGYTEVWSDYQRRVQADDPRLEEVLGLHWMTPIVHEGNLYAFSGRNEPDASFRCVGATGKPLNQDEACKNMGRPPTNTAEDLFRPMATHRTQRNRQARPLCPQRQETGELAPIRCRIALPLPGRSPWPPNAFISAAKPTSFATISPKNDNRTRGQ